MTTPLVDVRLRTRIAPDELQAKVAKLVTPADFNLLLTGPALVRLPDGRPLAIYLPGVMSRQITREVYAVLHDLRTAMTDNRGNAGGTPRVRRKAQNRTRTAPVASAIIGSMDPGGTQKWCRMTAWTGRHLPEWRTLQPFLQGVAAELRTHVPDRWQAQQAWADVTPDEWVVPGTPFTTVTVNNTYPTGVHTDKGDLDAGFSTIVCLRRGTYTGGVLTFPEYRVGVDMRDGDLLLMDAHQWHGNTPIVCECGHTLRKLCPACGAERISVVSYYRTKMAGCGTAEQEEARAHANREPAGVASDAPTP